ncbi:MAG: VOC family protein [Hyphomicrobiales bacterium]|nr:VOC family protein [Hyphomicrobiales bacterium]
MIHSIRHLSLVTADIDVAAEDYALLLGRKADGAIEADGTRQVWFSTGNIRLALIAPTGAGALADAARARLAARGEGLWEIAFAVDDLDAAKHLCARRALEPGEQCATPISKGGARCELRTLRISRDATHGLDITIVEALRDYGPPAAIASVSALDHIVIRTPNPNRAVEIYGGRFGLDLRLDRANPAWGARQLFFRCGDLVFEVVHPLREGVGDGPDLHGGLSWRTDDIAAARARLTGAGFNLSEVRQGRKPGSQVCTVRDRNHGVPTILFGSSPR